MRWKLVLFALLGFVVSPAMAVPPVEKGGKELAMGQKQSQETPMAAKPPEGAMVVVLAIAAVLWIVMKLWAIMFL